MVGCQNSEDDTLPCTNSTAGPVRPVIDSIATVSRLVGTRSSVMPGSSVSIAPPGSVSASTATPGYSRDQSGTRSTVHVASVQDAAAGAGPRLTALTNRT